MCFFIAGVQPRTRTIDAAARRCPRCGLFQARLQQVDHYLSLFFIPLIPIKRGVPFLYCQRCRQPVGDDGSVPRSATTGEGNRCLNCGRTVAPGFHYCPYCGTRC